MDKCKFCKQENLVKKKDIFNVEIEIHLGFDNFSKVEGISAKSDFDWKINYCPMCGRKLEEDK